MQIDLNNLPDQKYFTMGEASKILSVKDHVLRYWEKSFKQYFAVDRISGRRMFQKKDLITFLKIKEMTDKGLNIKAIKNLYLDIQCLIKHPDVEIMV